MRIGTMFAGRVDEIAGEAIETKFFILGVPLFPLSTHYLTSTATRQGFEIPISSKSVLLGYARMGLWIGGLLWGVLGWVTKHYSDGPEVLVGPAILLAAAAFVTWGVGGVPKGQRPQRLVLKAITGLAADPVCLPQDLRSKIFERLTKSWEERFPSRDWRQAVEAPTLEPEQTPLLYALASYASDRALSLRAWQRLASDDSSRGAPYR
jgi:hypothetical protein